MAVRKGLELTKEEIAALKEYAMQQVRRSEQRKEEKMYKPGKRPSNK